MLKFVNSAANTAKAHKAIMLYTGATLLLGASALLAPAIIKANSKPVAHKSASSIVATSTPSPSAAPIPSSTPNSTPAPTTQPVVQHVAPVAVATKKATTPITAPVVVSGQTLPPSQAQQVADWFNQYGGYLVNLGNDFNNFTTDANANNVAAVIADSNQIAADTTTGLNQPPIPDSQIQADNVAWLTDMHAGAQDFAAGLTNNDGTLAQQGINELTQGENELSTLDTDLSNL